MEAPGAACLSLCTVLGLLCISGANEVKTQKAQRTLALSGPAQIDIPSCTISPTDGVEWKEGQQQLLQKVKEIKKVKGDLNTQCNCKVLPNGTLHLQRVEKDASYFVEVHDQHGKQKCAGEVSVKTQEPVDTPFLNYTCSNKKRLEVTCVISKGSEAELEMSYEGAPPKSHTGRSHTLSLKGGGQSKNISCTARNQVSQISNFILVDCEGTFPDLYIYLAAGAGGVAFIIFISLIVYSVRSCRRTSDRREENMYNNDQGGRLQGRQLPQPPVQASAPPSSYLTTNETEELPPQNLPAQRQGGPEATPRGKKGKRPRPPEIPHGPPETLPMNPQQGPAPQGMRPALPGNHPKDQTPKPTPRTKSKPPRQTRKRQ